MPGRRICVSRDTFSADGSARRRVTRAGHTEAGCDLARLAGFSPAAMIVEILNDDGTMARRPDLERLPKRMI
jgi:3,4-dihydroxy-2-butanone 4-phosphate synthase